MTLTPIPRAQLGEVLDRFVARLEDPFSRAVFCEIRATPADRAVGAAAKQHRRVALSFARGLGMAVYPDGVECAYNWDGTALNSATEAYVILHEAAHFALAPTARRRLIDFGLEFGRLYSDDDMRLVVADKISPDNMRLWDIRTNEKLDKDRFRQDLEKVAEGYQEVARRLGILPEGGPADFKGPKILQ